ncbi:MAG: flagellin [Mahellales bacterium]|jgi:flagellin
MRINNNLMALNAHRQLSVTTNKAGKAMEKLSSGLRINRAGDDAAGLAISEKMRGQIRGLKQASRNAQDGISLIQTAEGALNETHAILQRMRELAIQSATDTNTNADRGELQTELEQLLTEITRIADNTEFNTKALLNGDLTKALEGELTNSTGVESVVLKSGEMDIDETASVAQTVNFEAESTTGANDGAFKSIAVEVTAAGTTVTATFTKADLDSGTVTKEVTVGELTFEVTVDQGLAALQGNGDGSKDTADTLTCVDKSLTFHIGANGNQNVKLGLSDMSAEGLGINGVDISTQAGADAAVTTIQGAIDKVSGERSKLGAFQNRLEHTISNLGTSAENLQAAESRIRDVDMAEEMMEFTKQNILQQAATAMLAQANMAPQSVLQLLG